MSEYVKFDSRVAIPRSVWLLGLVSFCMDLSSEMIHSVLPVFVVTTLGASPLWLGLIEGVAEATASISKVFSGVLSDRFGRRKPLIVIGYALAAISKPMFPLAQSAAWILGARFIDRVGKGIRGAPRDALIADITPLEVRGAAYGLRQAIDTTGALLGPLIALVLLTAVAMEMRTVFWIAAIPAVAAVVVLAVFVKEPASKRHRPNGVADLAGAAAPSLVPSAGLGQRHLGSEYWSVIVLAALMSVARFSEAFFILRSENVGLPTSWTPLALAVMNLVYVGTAYPFGKLSDRLNRTSLLAGGLLALLAAHLLLALAANLTTAFAGIALWGLHMGMTQGVLSALVSAAAPKDCRGAAFGVYHFTSGIALLVGSLLAGAIWSWAGPATTFLFGAAVSAGAIGVVVLWPRSRPLMVIRPRR